jgi:hypothetical protein
MVKSGLSEEVIIGAIERGPRDFDLSPKKLVELKEKGVSDKIVLAMQNAGKPGAATSSLPPGVLMPGFDSVAVTLVDGDKRVPMPQVVGTQRTRGGFVAKIELVMNGPKSALRITNKTPAFEVKLPASFRAEDVVSLIQPKEPKKKERFVELAYAHMGGMQEGKNPTVETTSERVAGQESSGGEFTIYLIRPTVPLKPGEYFVMVKKPGGHAMAMQDRAFYDFGVDGGK